MPDQTLRVDWLLERPITVPPRPLHLDALLAWARVDAAGGDISVQHDLPLARFVSGADDDSDDSWVWKASRVWFKPASTPFLVQTLRKVDYEDMAHDKGTVYEGRINNITPGTGVYKAFDMRTSHQWIHSAHAWCVGDQEQIQELLARVRHLGAKRRNGWGRITSTTVVDDPAAHTAWQWRVLATPQKGYAETTGTLRPPYWDRTQSRIVYEPLEVSPCVNT